MLTDGRRDCFALTWTSFWQQSGLLTPNSGCRVVVVDDAADEAFADWLDDSVGRLSANAEVVHNEQRRGFAGAIQTGWAHLPADAGYVWHLEDDFQFTRPVDLTAMQRVLDCHPHVVQLALRRQPWNDEERLAGGIVEQWPDQYEDRRDGDAEWLEHRLFFTTNPSLYRADLCRRGWPDAPRSEETFTQQILEDPNARFAFWGARDSGEWVKHVGVERVGCGY